MQYMKAIYILRIKGTHLIKKKNNNKMLNGNSDAQYFLRKYCTQKDHPVL